MSAVAEIPVPLATAAPWSRKFEGLAPRQRIRFAIGVVLLVAVAIAAIVIGRQPDWRVLYANLGDKDGGAVIAQLATMNVPYKYSEGGGAVMVPADRVYDLRLRLAAQGLPKGAVAGFEQMENNRFGMTQFQEKLSFQRGLEGELTRSIQAMSSVQSARVHLALPQQNGFFREQQKPTASVLLSLHPGRTLERNQIAGIVHLVASSVPELTPAAVSVVDDTGKLLSATSEPGSGADAQQLQYVQQIEQQYTRRILEMLEPVVGRQNVKAQVTADVDFSQTEATFEEHKPNLAADASAVRSQQTVESTGPGATGAPASGVPGATSNQPPGPSSTPINGAAAPLSPTGTAPGAAAAKPPSKRESTTNYEVDKTVKTVRNATGQIKRLSAAVVLNYQNVADAQGKAGPSTPLSAQQLEQMTALVRESIGFSKDRGDSVNLMNAQFLSERNEVAEVPIWKNPEMLDTARSFAWPVGLVLIGAIVLFGLVRPGLKTLATMQPPRQLTNEPGRQLNAMVADTPQRPSLSSPSVAEALPRPEAAEQARLEGARQMARQNPVAVANIVKTWVNGDDAAAASA
ncbi:flagellar M-ring protein FliF [Variovorax sp. PAMC28562]|uniref:flagellar basal-body MS-ring/collar protein FliF n=1 Tax=Variovorax sp. PAMC28562 TaxID=2762323 RepID=UPI00164D9437|nr:flagellar basal-body MS-ring/collar protein FliF [Variovorax sp. PAMC28562]QNK74344.1 flagellar M-ring protein FliF [Variovorax sp. PAMC28562]